MKSQNQQKRLKKSNKKKLEKDELGFLEECLKLISNGKKPDELKKNIAKI